MLLLEHDAKEVLAARGVPVPRGVLVPAGAEAKPVGAPPWMVKAQVPAGGRGKAGGICRVDGPDALPETLADLRGRRIHGHVVEELRIETAIDGATEAYLGLSLDAARARIVAMASAEGGVDVEAGGRIARAEALPDPADLGRAVETVVAAMPERLRAPLAAAGRLLSDAFLDLEATLIEVNPLFVLPGRRLARRRRSHGHRRERPAPAARAGRAARPARRGLPRRDLQARPGL